MPKLAIISASQAKRLMTKGRGKDDVYGATFDSLAREVAAGFFGYNISPDLSHLEAIQRGIEHEWLAIEAYKAETLTDVQYIGDDQRFITSPDYPFIGATPDGFVGSDGLLEVKNPSPANHWDNLVGNTQLDLYYYQLQMQLLVTGRTWVDWVSYDDGAPDPLKLHIVRVNRDEAVMAEMIERATECYNRAKRIAEDVATLKGIIL